MSQSEIQAHIKRLDLQPHPEGGYYTESYRSNTTLLHNQQPRAALTVIYYLLEAAAHSAWHRVLSDEVWHYYDGAALELFVMSPNCQDVERIILDSNNRHAVIPAGHWQAAKATNDYTLCGCCVSPGFDFADFILLRDHPRHTNIQAPWNALL